MDWITSIIHMLHASQGKFYITVLIFWSRTTRTTYFPASKVRRRKNSNNLGRTNWIGDQLTGKKDAEMVLSCKAIFDDTLFIVFRSCVRLFPSSRCFIYCVVLLNEAFGLTKYGPAFNLVLSSPLHLSCLWPSPPWWQDNQKAKEWGSRGREESWNEDSRPKTKICQFSGWSGMSEGQSTWCQLFRKDECHGKWKDLSNLGSVRTSW